MRQPFGDLDHLLLTGRQPGHRQARVEVDLEIGQDPARPFEHQALSDDAEAVDRLAAGIDVLGDAQRADEAALLVDHRDAGVRGALLAQAGDRHTVQLDRAAVGLVDPRHQVHQRRLAGTVLADQRMNLAALHIERDVVDRAHAGKGLDDVAHRQPRRSGSGIRHFRSGGGRHAQAQDRVSPAIPVGRCRSWHPDSMMRVNGMAMSIGLPGLTPLASPAASL